jgi:arginine exporter protein ArgO
MLLVLLLWFGRHQLSCCGCCGLGDISLHAVGVVVGRRAQRGSTPGAGTLPGHRPAAAGGKHKLACCLCCGLGDISLHAVGVVVVVVWETSACMLWVLWFGRHQLVCCWCCGWETCTAWQRAWSRGCTRPQASLCRWETSACMLLHMVGCVEAHEVSSSSHTPPS